MLAQMHFMDCQEILIGQLKRLQKALSKIYGNIKLKEIKGKEGKRLFAMFMEDEVCVQ